MRGNRALPPKQTLSVLALAAALFGCRAKQEIATPPPSPAVLTLVVHAGPEPALTRRGAVAAGARLRLGFNAPGVLAAIGPRTGDVVRRGQLLARLKDADAAANLQAAQASRARALQDFGAAEQLASTGAVS